MEGDLVDGDVHGEAGVLHRVAGEVLDAGHGVALHAAGQGGAHLAHVMGILAVGLLGPAPGRVAQDVDAHPAVQVGSHRPQLEADGLADPLLELHVPGGAPGHAHREAGGLVHHHAPRAVGEGEAGQPEAVHPGGPERALVVALLAQVDEAGPERRVAVQAPQLLVRRHRGHGGPPLVVGRVARQLGRFGGHGKQSPSRPPVASGTGGRAGVGPARVSRSGRSAGRGGQVVERHSAHRHGREVGLDPGGDLRRGGGPRCTGGSAPEALRPRRRSSGSSPRTRTSRTGPESGWGRCR